MDIHQQRNHLMRGVLASRTKRHQRCHSPNDTRRAASGSQPRRLFLYPPVGNHPAGGFAQTISTQHELRWPTKRLVSAGINSLMFRVVPCAFRRVKTCVGIRVNISMPSRRQRHLSTPLERREEAHDA